MLQGEHSAILSTFIKLPFVIKSFVLSIFEGPFYTGFTVFAPKEPYPGTQSRKTCLLLMRLLCAFCSPTKYDQLSGKILGKREHPDLCVFISP